NHILTGLDLDRDDVGFSHSGEIDPARRISQRQLMDDAAAGKLLAQDRHDKFAHAQLFGGAVHRHSDASGVAVIVAARSMDVCKLTACRSSENDIPPIATLL